MGKVYHVRFKRGKHGEHVTFVESDSKIGVEYQIARLPNGDLACACMGYVFNKDDPKTCKHIDAFVLGGSLTSRRETAIIATQVADRVVTQRGGETFTFRRAFSFDGALR